MIRRHLLTLLCQAALLFCLSPVASSQSRKPEESLYLIAFRAAAEERVKAYGPLGQDYHNMIVEKALMITDLFPEEMGPFHLKILDAEALCARFKTTGSFSVFAVRPMQNLNDRLKITILEYHFSCRGDSFHWALSEAAIVTFKYDCAKGRFAVEGVELTGV